MLVKSTLMALMGLTLAAEASNIHRTPTLETLARRQNKNGNNNGGGGGGGGQNGGSATCLAANALQTGSQSTGQNGAVAADGQVNSNTDNANFINECAGKTLTNGIQNKLGSCNGIPMGNIPATTQMVSSVILNPKNLDTVPEKQTFNITVNVANMALGFFTNATSTYYSAPQRLDGQGRIIGHTHVTVQDTGSSLNPQQPLDATKFVFFKGINDNGNGNGLLSAVVTGGLPAGNYRVCCMAGASNHQPVLMPVAQRGAQDDCKYFTVVAGGGGGNNNNAGNAGAGATNGAAAGGSVDSGASSSSAAAAASSSAAAAGGKNGGGKTGGGRGGNKGGQNSSAAAAAATTTSTSAAAAAATTSAAAAGGKNGGGKTGGGRGGNKGGQSAAAAAAATSTTAAAAAAAATTSAAAAAGGGRNGGGRGGNKGGQSAAAAAAATSTTAAAAAAATTSAAAAAGGKTTNNAAAGSAIAGQAAPAVVDSGDAKRPFKVNNDTFVNKAAAVQRSCAIQNNLCADAVNSGKAAGKTVSDCNTQEQACNAAGA